MATLFDLVGDWKTVYEMADDPEMDAQVWFDTMDAIEGNLEEKAEAYAHVQKQLEADAKAYAEEAERLFAKANTAEKNIERIKAHMKAAMEAVGKDRLSAGVYTYAIQRNGGVLPLEIDTGINVAELPVEFVRANPEVNNKAVRAALDAGQALSWARYGERGTSLRLK